MTYFNPHSREGSDSCSRKSLKIYCNFNPHSREGSDGVICAWRRTKIEKNFNPHSAKGVTFVKTFLRYILEISIHTAAKGVTKDMMEAFFAVQSFNPHSREGSDMLENGMRKRRSDISIHTPAKGVTWMWRARRSTNLFESTLPRRE